MDITFAETITGALEPLAGRTLVLPGMADITLDEGDWLEEQCGVTLDSLQGRTEMFVGRVMICLAARREGLDVTTADLGSCRLGDLEVSGLPDDEAPAQQQGGDEGDPTQPSGLPEHQA